MPKEVPGTSEVSENSQVQPRHFPDRKDTGAGRPYGRLNAVIGSKSSSIANVVLAQEPFVVFLKWQ